MFNNLWNASQAFRDFIIFRNPMGHFDRLTEKDIEATLRANNKIALAHDDLGNPVKHTLSEAACVSFFRQNPDTVGTDRDYYLSKFYQFLVLWVRAACKETSDEELHLTYPLYNALAYEVANLPPALITLDALRQFDYFVIPGRHSSGH